MHSMLSCICLENTEEANNDCESFSNSTYVHIKWIFVWTPYMGLNLHYNYIPSQYRRMLRLFPLTSPKFEKREKLEKYLLIVIGYTHPVACMLTNGNRKKKRYEINRIVSRFSWGCKSTEILRTILFKSVSILMRNNLFHMQAAILSRHYCYHTLFLYCFLQCSLYERTDARLHSHTCFPFTKTKATPAVNGIAIIVVADTKDAWILRLFRLLIVDFGVECVGVGGGVGLGLW